MKNENLDWLSPKAKKLIAEGRCKGELNEYVPWVLSTEIPSKGRATRILSYKTNRIHHLLSDAQLRAFLILERCDNVYDIKETYALLDVMETINNKDDLRFDLFFDNQKNEQFVITTNFLLTTKDEEGNIKYEARSVKNCSSLNKKITIEKMEIERRYWATKGINFKVITDKQLPRQYYKNIEWVRETIIDNLSEGGEKIKLAGDFHKFLINNKEKTLKSVLSQFDNEIAYKKGHGLYLFRYLVATKVIRVNMNNKINFLEQINKLIL